jgi:hypothetical protein
MSWVYYSNEAIMILLWKNVNEISCAYNRDLAESISSINTFLSSNDSSKSISSTRLNSIANTHMCLLNGNEVLEQISMHEVSF